MFESIMNDTVNLIQTLLWNFDLKIEDMIGKEEIFEDLVKQAKSAGIKVMVEQKLTTDTYNYTEIDRAFKTELVRLIKAA